MLPQIPKTPLLSLIALLAGSALAQQADPAATPSELPGPASGASYAPPPMQQPPAPERRGIKTYTGPIENPEDDCTATSFGEADVRKAEAGLGHKLLSRKCLNQSDSLTRAGEASSYLGYYLMTGSKASGVLNDPKRQQQIAEAMKACVTENSGNCTTDHKAAIMLALMQYNLVREARANMLINNTNRENLKTMEARDEKNILRSGIVDSRYATEKTVRKSEPVLRQTFMLDPKAVAASVNATYDRSVRSEEEREILGPSFLQDYKAFIDAYTRSEPRDPNHSWHYVAAKSSAVAGNGRWVIASGREGKPVINEARERSDRRTLESANVQQIVQEFKGLVEKEKPQSVDGRPDADLNKKLRVDNLGLGLPSGLPGEPNATPSDVAAAVVVNINSQIHAREEEGQEAKAMEDAMQAQVEAQKAQARYLSSAGTGVTAPAQAVEKKAPYVSVTVDESLFRDYLDRIWPVPGQAGSVEQVRQN